MAISPLDSPEFKKDVQAGADAIRADKTHTCHLCGRKLELVVELARKSETNRSTCNSCEPCYTDGQIPTWCKTVKTGHRSWADCIAEARQISARDK